MAAIGEQMNRELVAVSFESFIKHYAPFQPSSEVVDKCLERLRTDGLVVPTTAGVDRFAGFQEPPSRQYTSKKVAYGHLSAICRSISQVAVDGRVVSCSLVQEPDTTTGSQNPEASHAIDGYCKPVTSTVPPPNSPEEEREDTADIAVNCEWMLPESDDDPVLRHGDVIHSRLNAVSAALHEMNNDPRRTHMYSTTIEDEAMCLWYWSRSHSAKSEAVDITQNVRATVHGLVSFLFANMVELGYDENIQRRLDPKDGRCYYVFRVGDRYFKSCRCIFEHRNTCISGRSTRVFKVVQVPSFDDITEEATASPMVLKDVWLDTGAKTEKEIQDAIFARLDTVARKLQDGQDLPHFAGLEDAEKSLLRDALRDGNYKQHFLTIDCDTRGALSKSLLQDSRRPGNLFSPRASEAVPAKFAIGDTSRSQLRLPPDPPIQCPFPPRSFLAKYQYRVVFNNNDCLLAVQLLFLAGWVHRDISSGNLLWDPKSKRGILSDLEYAKEFNAEGTGSSDPKTGTPAFMATEIISQRLILFSNPDLSSEDQMNALLKPIIHNFQHDLESFFWLLLWILTTRISTCTPPPEVLYGSAVPSRWTSRPDAQSHTVSREDDRL
ncbi:hypothetical protein DICSQDRAFT_173936 [Dichomitus squalens LYAD-421 SS1]|uniref:Protein kinase domain-containing protein n=1 Tax=Dichomitus squalens (strain LYAD-421) TaxID=732165 RepID=R7SP11_DICSQ|nr:uncharacterized protein DICSQDRAFT_173936 [Dichomitus squalens LYAD-421 SS1]EJF57480.1 hypothetical protein DICSQDRAFT_173936 [Dichomitus squalens LYAD-421 SS1]